MRTRIPKIKYKFLVIYKMGFTRKGKQTFRVMNRFLKSEDEFNKFISRCEDKEYKILVKYKLKELI